MVPGPEDDYLDAVLLRRVLGEAGSRYVLRCVRTAEAVTRRRDAISPPVAADRWRRMLSAAVELGTGAAVSGSAAVPFEDEQAAWSPTTWIDTTEAATMLGTGTRNVRDRCERGSLVTARKVDGRWVVDFDEVAGIVAARSAA